MRQLAYALALGLGAWLLAPQLFASKPPPSASLASGFDLVDVPAKRAESSDASAVARHVDISLPDTAVASAQHAPTVPRSLDICLKQGNLIDQSVADCRFGNTGQPEPGHVSATRMVSAKYMADFKAGHVRRPAGQYKPYQIATVSIREWDGRNAYRAQWRISDNLIENESVCDNFANASIERRECRRSAQVFFKEQCKEWGRRVAKNNDAPGKSTQAQYCTAAATFNPTEG